MYKRYFLPLGYFDLMLDEIIILVVVSQKLFLLQNDMRLEILENIAVLHDDIISEMLCLYECREYDELVRHLM